MPGRTIAIQFDFPHPFGSVRKLCDTQRFHRLDKCGIPLELRRARSAGINLARSDVPGQTDHAHDDKEAGKRENHVQEKQAHNPNRGVSPRR